MDNPQIEAAFMELQQSFEAFKTTNDEALEARAMKGDIPADVKEKLDVLQGVMETREAELVTAKKTADDAKAELETHAQRMDELETALARSGASGEPSSEDMLKLREGACQLILADSYDKGRPIDLQPHQVDELDVKAFKAYSDNFITYLRRDSDKFMSASGIPDLETRLLSVDRDPGGGYWVKPEMSSRIATIVRETSPVREHASVETIGSDSLELIIDEDQAGFGWVSEQADRPETTTPDIGKKTIHAHELYAEPRVTQKLLDDAGFNVENWLAQKVAERFGRAENTAHVNGTGVGQPRGILTYPSGTARGQIEQINSGSSGAVVADGLLDLIYSLKGPYLRAARFMMQRLTVRDVRKLKDGQSQYLWQPGLQAGEPGQLLGYPVHQADDVAAIAGGSLSIIFGDFARGYTIVDRIGIRVLRDPYTAKPYIKLYTTRRTGGDVVVFEALKIQVLT